MKEQTNLTESFKEAVWDKYVWDLFDDGIITDVDAWLLTGEYEILKNGFPDVEADLPDNIKVDVATQRALARVKFSECVIPESAMEDLCIQRLSARPRFRGVVANKPLTYSHG